MALWSTWPWSVISCLRTVLLDFFQRRKKRSHWSLGRAARTGEAPQGPFFHRTFWNIDIRRATAKSPLQGLTPFSIRSLTQQDKVTADSCSEGPSWHTLLPSGCTPVPASHHTSHASPLFLMDAGKGPGGQILCEVCGRADKYNLSSSTVLLFKGRQPTISS